MGTSAGVGKAVGPTSYISAQTRSHLPFAFARSSTSREVDANLGPHEDGKDGAVICTPSVMRKRFTTFSSLSNSRQCCHGSVVVLLTSRSKAVIVVMVHGEATSTLMVTIVGISSVVLPIPAQRPALHELGTIRKRSFHQVATANRPGTQEVHPADGAVVHLSICVSLSLSLSLALALALTLARSDLSLSIEFYRYIYSYIHKLLAGQRWTAGAQAPQNPPSPLRERLWGLPAHFML